MADAWLKFYPQDWRADERLRNCGLAARGLWMEMLALMHRSERYGYLLINGKAPTDRQLAVQVGSSADELAGLISELEAEAVFSRDRSGAIYSRRMIRDEKRANHARKIGKKGGNPSLLKETDNLAQDNPPDKPEDNGGDNAQKPEARYQKESKKESLTLENAREPQREVPPPGITDAGSAFEYVVRAARWRPATDQQRLAALRTVENWLASGYSLELVLAGIEQAIARRPGTRTNSLNRFTATIAGMYADGPRLNGSGEGERQGVKALTSSVAKHLVVGG